jgi:hypothetical protein
MAAAGGGGDQGGGEPWGMRTAGTAILQADGAMNGRQYDRHSCLSVGGDYVGAGSRQTGVSVVLSEKRWLAAADFSPRRNECPPGT